jgi:hypothetical protein
MRESIANLAGLLFSVYEHNDIQTCILWPVCHSKYTCRWRFYTKAIQLLQPCKKRHFTSACDYLVIASNALTNLLILVAHRYHMLEKLVPQFHWTKYWQHVSMNYWFSALSQYFETLSDLQIVKAGVDLPKTDTIYVCPALQI